MANIIKSNDDNFVPDFEAGFRRILSDNYAFIGYSYYLDSIDPETKCQVYQVGEPLATVFNGVGVQKRKIYLNVILQMFKCYLLLLHKQ